MHCLKTCGCASVNSCFYTGRAIEDRHLKKRFTSKVKVMGTPMWATGGSGGPARLPPALRSVPPAASGPGRRCPAPAAPPRPGPARPGRKAEGRRPKAAARGPGGAGAAMADQSYCHRLQHDMYFLTSTSRLNEQVVDKIVLQLNRVYPQILTNEEAEKFRNPKASLPTRLSDLLKHLQKKGDRHCQEFYRALQINAEQLFNDLPSRKILKTPDPTEIDTDKEQYMLNDRGPVFFLACFSVAAGLALFWYCCNSEAQVIGRARRILGFSPIIIGRHVRSICMLYLEDMSRN
ncbi:caspase recruitment domain-containing protein 19 isoform X2 [Motacilla alba alba]|uniref:caspase recruitment domain-containing protein 19 isoform X2 n=1 Tax=Motacilla alba alba TaxID=1094192 RepID=UPI0018D592A7|nr:caspase recruitment domain-containing protein 19 isoform X2 [Motacilla alba alba]